MRRDRQTGGRGTAWNSLLLTAGLALGTGCTMCPSPFDYSGTVPGAADQNDFRVRNNGILPIWQRPRPWPPVVSNSPDGGPADRRVDERSVPDPAPRRIVAAAGEVNREEIVSVLLTAGPDTPELPGEVVPAVHDVATTADDTGPVTDEPALVAPEDAPDKGDGQAALAD